ncbi:aldo/keto reductase [Pseudomonas sp. Choline-3u-10]|jgi:aryl-alcohol dehydrogenase-like predicted oxidoreductase|uniref:General stress protein n=1 Tax=Stutzerimonas stutzeri TaxID=316 RepID=A0A172WKP0_STUST|nr:MULTISPECIES: aldo/keto reductase [Pseudomonadaceae]MBU0947952.1 aldo/keto reductase [Gammaproteobacteria bacterium]HBM09319.1 aldo/keto reductase [Pseudomonas sp.]ANF23896.1 general stress protein [Stutzerimonas stutzeri]KJJ63475.1 general stress protein [Pseudomonas sp. 10B238]MBK3794715.1 general stress protein [Stutzerimonas stutzeri]|tara:strand:+ start:1494 stop:2483 length:990 start_codon:yes stop_codon:yes gene_type:complete
MSIETLSIEGIATPVSRIGLGTWAIGGWMWGGADDDRSVTTIRSALERGINLIDTAPVYGFGHSEEVVGKALEGVRDQAVIATKVALDWSEGGPRRNSTPARIRQEIEDSLRRLRTDRIDLYQVHWPDPLVPIEETAAELEKLRQEGKILAIGVSNYSTEQMDTFRKAAPLASVQPPYNLFERAIEADVLPYARDNGLVVLGYGALCRGLLSGRMTSSTTFDGDDLRKSDPKFKSPRFEQYLAAVEALKALAHDRHGKSVLALAIRWVLDQGPTIALWGARRPDQLDGIDDAFGWSLSPQDLTDIDALLAEHITDPVGPEFMAPPSRKA